MKVLVVLMGLITATFLSGVPATSALAITIRAYNNTGELNLDVLAERGAFTLGTSVLLTCDVTGRFKGDKVINYTWEHNCSGGTNGRCEIQDRDPYYRVVNDTLLVDVTSWDQGGKYYCTVRYLNLAYEYAPVDWTPKITVAGNPLPFLYTPTSLLPEHSVLTDVRQATGTNGEQWITCRSGGQRTRTEIWMGSVKVVANSSTNNSARIGLGTQHPNGLYHCSSAQSQRQYFSLFLRSSVTLPTPNVSVQNTTSMLTLTSPDGSRVERYIVEFECSVRNITFVEKYMSVNASGGTGRVSTCVSCFGGLGQLNRVKVWAVSGPSISRALVYIPDGQCREEDGSGTPTTTTTPTTAATPPGNTDKSPSTPTGPHISSTSNVTMQSDGGSGTATTPTTPTTPTTTTPPGNTGTFIAVGVGVGVFLLFVMLIMVVIILVAVFVKRKTVYKQKRDAIMGDNLYCSNTVVVKQEMELTENGVGADNEDMDSYESADSYEDVDSDQSEEEGPLTDGHYEDVDRMVHIKNLNRPFSKESAPPTSTTNVPAVYAVVDKSKGATRQKMDKTEDGSTASNSNQYAMPMRKMGEMTGKGEGWVASGCVEEERYDDIIGLTYEPKANGQPW